MRNLSLQVEGEKRTPAQVASAFLAGWAPGAGIDGGASVPAADA